ncbi:MAG: putative baseplate assembly protein, partial [Algicola sp.]|nr:putative baseplate assembly protein [Algicola sp.]
DSQWLSMFPEVIDASIYDDLLNDIKACCSAGSLALALSEFSVETDAPVTPIILDSTAIKAIVWQKVNAEDYATPSLATTGMIWLRVKPKPTFTDYTVQAIDSLYFNTVSASAQETFRSLKLGVSNGKPNQCFKLPKTPLLFDTLSQQPKLAVISIENNAEQVWQWVSDFYEAQPDSLYYSFEPLAQSVQFGDGLFGAIPNAGAQIYVAQMEVGGGLAANVGSFTISKLKRAISHVDSVTNPLAAFGGRDTESFKQTRLRAAHEIKHRDRAVTAEDFAELARQTPSVPIHAAYALANTKLTQVAADGQTIEVFLQLNVPGVVTVVILPNTTDDQPYPTPQDIKAVCAYLDQRRLITTELYVVGPEYISIDLLSVDVSIRDGFDISAISQRVQSILLNFFHPVTGGKQGDGWPFGEDVYLSDIFCQILAIDGVSRAYNLKVEINGMAQTDDRITIEGQQLISLKSNAMNIKVDYEY